MILDAFEINDGWSCGTQQLMLEMCEGRPRMLRLRYKDVEHCVAETPKEEGASIRGAVQQLFHLAAPRVLERDAAFVSESAALWCAGILAGRRSVHAEKQLGIAVNFGTTPAKTP